MGDSPWLEASETMVTSGWWMLVGAAFGAGFVSGAVTVALAEATALTAAAMPVPTRAAVLVAFTAGHVAGKGLWYWVGTQGKRVTRPSFRRAIDKAHALAERHPTLGFGLTFSSAAFSIPPFHLVAITAGIMRLPPLPFFLLAFLGRLLRFSLIAASPSMLRWVFGA